VQRIIIIGGGVAGSEAGTYIGENAQSPLEIIEIEYMPQRKFGGWGFQSFPGESTNLAMRKMYLGRDPEDIFKWAKTVEGLDYSRDQTFPRALMQEYVRWRRKRVTNPLAFYHYLTGEAVRVFENEEEVKVFLKDGRCVVGDRLIMASGSISVKIPAYLADFLENDRVIIDPLTLEGHQKRQEIPKKAKILVLGTGLTGEEQANVLLKSGHTSITLFSRGGQRHYPYPKEQTNEPLVLNERPEFLMAETPEEFNSQLQDFFSRQLVKGHAPEDIFSAMRPFWNDVRAELGGCYKAAERLRTLKRSLAVSSIGAPWEVGNNVQRGQQEGKVSICNGEILRINKLAGSFRVEFDTGTKNFDWIINAVGRNIIRHSLWEQLLEDGLAKKHAGIGVRVGESGRMISRDDVESSLIWVVGMARAGDHALRHGFLGNTAFNVPMVRNHIYDTMDDLLTTVGAHEQQKLENIS
jgi:uncharacterized NAD(P)/FAD-binding protein YdhS